jgi:polysaccharide pyruvyl transferase WcaK-like protein/glycosyltransferase involved in cell wall biosynthesis
MSGVLICGAAGFTNLGDDAILWGMLTQLRHALPGRRIRVVGGPELTSTTARFDALPLTYDDREELSRAIEDAALVILGGGGMLYDIGYHASLSRFLTDPPDRQLLYELAKLAAAARVAHRPVMLYGVGVGPLLTSAARQAARFIGEEAVAITVRDQASADALGDCGVTPARIHVAADPAVVIEPAEAEAADRLLSESGLLSRPRPWVAVNLRPWYRFGQSDAAGEGAMARLVEHAAAVVRGLAEDLGGTPVLLPCQRLYDDDLELAGQVVAAAGLGDGRAHVLDVRASAPDLLSLLGRFDLAVGMRMHFLLLALGAGVPFVAMSYATKVEELARAAGLQDHLHRVDDLDPAAVLASCQSLLANREAASRSMAAARSELREAAATSAELARAVLEAEGVGPRVIPRAPVHLSSAKGLRVLMQTRADYRERPGGDVVQLEELLPYLREAGLEVTLTVEESPDLSGWDLVHTINLDRPGEPYQHCLNALAQGKPVVVSPVHTDMSEFLDWGDPRYWDLPDPAVGPPQPRPAPPPTSVERRSRALLHQQRRAILDWATAYLPNAQADADYLHRAFGMDLSRSVVVHHGISPTFFGASPEPFVAKHGLRDFVICSAARVEARKNQLALVAAMRGTGIPLVIIGQPNPESYRDLCRRYADDNVRFLDAMPQQELASAYAAAKVHALVSWFEVPGLVSLEAGAAGCNIVSTNRGSPREYLGDLAWYCDPRSLDSIRTAVLAAYQAPRSEALRERIRTSYTWEQAARCTLEGYQLAMALHRAQPREERRAAMLTAMQRHTDWMARRVADKEYELRQVHRWASELDAHARHLQAWGSQWEAQSRALEDNVSALEAHMQMLADEINQRKAELARITSRRLYRWSETAARAVWSILRRLGMKP